MTTPNQTWDQFEVGGNYIEFALGVPVEGTILNIGAKRWDDGKLSPQLTLDNPLDPTDPRVLTAGWVMLVKKLKEVAPNVGDRIRVTWTSTGAKPKEMRDFAVEMLAKGNSAAPVPTSAAQPSSTPTAATATPANSAPAIGAAVPASTAGAEAPTGITPEQLAAMQAMSAPAAAWDSDPRVAQLRGMGIADDAIRSTLNI